MKTPPSRAGTIAEPRLGAKLRAAIFYLRRSLPWATLIQVTGAEFIGRLRRLARKRGAAFGINTRRGRGSHRIVYFGARRTTVKDLKEEIGKGLLRQMCSDLGIDLTDLA